MKNNKKQLLMLVAMLSCLGVGTFHTTIIQAMETDNIQKMKDILNELQALRMGLVGNVFSTDLHQTNIFAASSRNLNNSFMIPHGIGHLNMHVIDSDLRLIARCEGALKQFAPPSPLAETVKPDMWPAIDKSLALLRELRELIIAEGY